MANELNNAIKASAEKIAKYVSDIATLSVETRYLDVGQQGVTFTQAQPVARTEIRLDGDCFTTLPAKVNQANAMAVDGDLFDVHQRNVQTAIDYRAKMIASLMNLLRQGPPQP